MSDPTPAPARKIKASFSPAEGFDALVLLSRNFTEVVAHVPALTTRTLSVDAYSILVGLAADAASPVGKIAKRTALKGSVARAARKRLMAQGLIAETKGTEGPAYVITPTGQSLLAAIHVEISDLLASGGVELNNVQRLAGVTRGVAKALRVPKEAAGEKPSQAEKKAKAGASEAA